MIGIYKITNPKNKIYIGQSINIKRRFRRYRNSDCKGQRLLLESFKTYGVDKHTFEIILECNEFELNELERYYQEIYNAIGLKGLNCMYVKTNKRRVVLSKETILRKRNSAIGKKLTEEHKLLLSKAKTGTKHTDATKNKMRLARLNMSEEIKLRIKKSYVHSKWSSKIVLDTSNGVFYESAKDASKYSLYKYDILTNYLNGKRKNKTTLIYV